MSQKWLWSISIRMRIREIKDIFILEDLSNYIEEDKIKYYIRKIAEHAKFTNTHAIILSAVYKLPTKLEKYVTVL